MENQFFSIEINFPEKVATSSHRERPLNQLLNVVRTVFLNILFWGLEHQHSR